MNISQSQSLAQYSSMRLGGLAKFVCEVFSKEDVVKASNFATENNLPLITVGDGTNVLFKDEGYPGVVVVNKLKGIKLEKQQLVASAGENWDSVVELAVKNHLAGIEALSLIPGTVGGGPVNNIGAYGQEIKDTLESIEAYDTLKKDFVVLTNEECSFGYRESIFKNKSHGRYIISSVNLKLNQPGLDYQIPKYIALADKLKDKSKPTLSDVRKAVIDLRESKLPDPKTTPNTGSFFKNPIVKKSLLEEIKHSYPLVPSYPVSDDLVKIPAGWLIDQAGFKGKEINGFKVYDKQALVLVNVSASQFSELKATYEHIQRVIKKQFNVSLQLEPEIL
ncbi:UDP-N-acetylmuramate dehydrogenase [Candidatus Nomurabacteria bacterium]|jgi:UDP-N-acetylmuramate dehydrogenase|nr:UDP-N-acetylmuramate dehydrogenase [Candidatus Nomurabacteria bacterium]